MHGGLYWEAQLPHPPLSSSENDQHKKKSSCRSPALSRHKKGISCSRDASKESNIFNQQNIWEMKEKT